MRWQVLAAAALTAATAGPASAQIGEYRRFTHEPMDTNRSNKIIYAPVGWAFSGRRPAAQPRSVAVASWYLQPLGSRNDRADKVLDKGEYTLESFDAVRPEGDLLTRMRVVITRMPAPPEGTDLPELNVVHPRTLISSRAVPAVETIPGGVRYTFTLTPPMFGFAPAGDVKNLPSTSQFQLELLPARALSVPRHIARKPTFNQEDAETLRQLPPPRLTVEERVAGKRLEYREGRVTESKR